ncbi:hypothetical protein QBC37DRAFT_477888 [Rhypophila decipiens]|uniref:Uncharacterized protein n=1 Tax=Rhypophila decipiens TaxID=261697 RepID=A0AAN7BB48_9PEZI|nr:hypothetical protein QBC37DRAFT_477888 [Rhypophila decipiens]
MSTVSVSGLIANNRMNCTNSVRQSVHTPGNWKVHLFLGASDFGGCLPWFTPLNGLQRRPATEKEAGERRYQETLKSEERYPSSCWCDIRTEVGAKIHVLLIHNLTFCSARSLWGNGGSSRHASQDVKEIILKVWVTGAEVLLAVPVRTGSMRRLGEEPSLGGFPQDLTTRILTVLYLFIHYYYGTNFGNTLRRVHGTQLPREAGRQYAGPRHDIIGQPLRIRGAGRRVSHLPPSTWIGRCFARPHQSPARTVILWVSTLKSPTEKQYYFLPFSAPRFSLRKPCIKASPKTYNRDFCPPCSDRSVKEAVVRVRVTDRVDDDDGMMGLRGGFGGF